VIAAVAGEVAGQCRGFSRRHEISRVGISHD
jgi:hypothetical protein